MFTRNPQTTVVPPKAPLVTGGAAMMLKSMGVDPAEMERITEQFLADVNALVTRIDTLEQSVVRLEAVITAQTQLLATIAAQVSRDE
jgi:hypothetical protein